MPARAVCGRTRRERCMTRRNRSASPDSSSTARSPSERPSAACVVPCSPSTHDNNPDYCQDANRQEYTDSSQAEFPDNLPMATGKSRELKRELLRMSWLIRQLQRDGIGQAEMERRTGIESSHLNKLLNYEGARRKGLGADIIRQVRDGLKIDLGTSSTTTMGSATTRFTP